MIWRNTQEVNRRAAISRMVVFGVFATLVLAFFRVQVLSSERYQLQSKDNRLRAVALPAPRGLITDRNGIVLAENVPGYSIALHAASAESLMVTLRRLSPILELDSAGAVGVMERYRRAPSEPVFVRHDAPFEMVSALEEQRVWNPGLLVQSEPKRRYPFADTTSHVLGYVSEITEEELRAAVVPNARAGMLIGRVGLEAGYDRRLRGQDGLKFNEHDALGRTVRVAIDENILQPQPGQTIRTTLDLPLLRYIAQQFPEGRRGAVVAMVPRTGEILALYSAPSYDPNLMVGAVDPEQWSALIADPDQPLFNRAIQGLYPPASPWKLAVAAFALRRGMVNIDTRMTIPCTGGMRYGNRYFRCWNVAGHGDVTLGEAIRYSCDVYFYQLGLKLGLNNLLHDATALGMAERTGIDIPNENQPIFPPSTEYYNQRYGPRGWTNAVTLNLAIGQGENSQTVMSMTRFYAMLANPHGIAPTPRLLLDSAADEPENPWALGLTDRSLSDLRLALVEVVDRGTAAGARIADLHIAGKTGTAQNPHGPDHGWFLAFAPLESPEIVVGAIVEFAEHGSQVAPLVTRIIARYLLGEEAPEITGRELVTPPDSAPLPVPLLPDTSRSRPPTGTETDA